MYTNITTVRKYSLCAAHELNKTFISNEIILREEQSEIFSLYLIV